MLYSRLGYVASPIQPVPKVYRKWCVWFRGNPFYFVAIFSKIVACVTAKIMRIHQFSIRIQFCVCLDLYFWFELNLMFSFRNKDMHLWKQKFWAQKNRKLVFSSFFTLFVIPNRQIIVWMHLVILWIGIAEGTFDFDLEWKKRSSIATILENISYTFNWIPNAMLLNAILKLLCKLHIPVLGLWWTGTGSTTFANQMLVCVTTSLAGYGLDCL